MTTSGAETLTWDVENRPLTVAQGGKTIAAYVYDGDGNRVKKTERGSTIVYVNKYYEKNLVLSWRSGDSVRGEPVEGLTTGDITTYYYLGDRLVVFNKGLSANLHFVSDDHLTGTSVITNQNNDTVIGSIRYMPFGAARTVTGTIETEIKFTGQRLDSGADLYYYGARYYDADMEVEHPLNFSDCAVCAHPPRNHGANAWLPNLFGSRGQESMSGFLNLLRVS